MFWRKLSQRLKIIFAIIASLLLILGVMVVYVPKQNNIPVLPLAVKLEFTSAEDTTLSLRNVSFTHDLTPDYQTDIPDHYYDISILSQGKQLFHGKTPNAFILIGDNFSQTDPQNFVTKRPLGDFVLFLPYYKEADMILLQSDEAREPLRIDLKEYNSQAPSPEVACGDGICADNENVLTCRRDCTVSFKQLLRR